MLNSNQSKTWMQQQRTTSHLYVSLGARVVFPCLIEEGWMKHRGDQGSMDSIQPAPPSSSQLPSARLDVWRLYSVWSMGDLSISRPLEAGNLYSSSRTACSALCGDGSVPLCPFLLLTSSAAHWLGTTDTYSNLALIVKKKPKKTSKMMLFVMLNVFTFNNKAK